MAMNHASPLGKIKGAIVIICLVLILGILGCAYISDIYTTVLGKDEITDKIKDFEEKETDYTYVSSYLKRYGIGNINAYKINEAESKINEYFYQKLPDKETVAKTIANLFLEHFYDKIDLNDKNAVTDAVLQCYVAALEDPYAYYRTAKEYLDYSQDLESGDDFVGVGIQFDRNTQEITMVYRDSGAYDAGIRAKDIFYGVNGKTTDDTDIDTLLNMIAGEPGTTVKIKVKRGGEVLEFDVVRKVLTTKTVSYEILDDNVGYIYISQFLGTTYAEFVEAVDYCTEMNVSSLVIDLRYNPGGLVSSVAQIIDYIVPDAEGRKIVSYYYATSEQAVYTSDGHSVDVPIAVICNEYTASAGEIFTGAIRDYRNEGIIDAVIVGKTTYGKGIVQSSFTLYDSSALTFTISHFYTFCGVNFHKVGIDPDFVVEELYEEDVPLKTAIDKVLLLVEKESTAAYGFAA